MGRKPKHYNPEGEAVFPDFPSADAAARRLNNPRIQVYRVTDSTGRFLYAVARDPTEAMGLVAGSVGGYAAVVWTLEKAAEEVRDFLKSLPPHMRDAARHLLGLGENDLGST